MSIADSAPSGALPVAGTTELKKGSIGVVGALMQSVTTIAPAIAGLFTIPLIVSDAGEAAPLAYLGAFLIVLMLGFVLSQYTKHMTSAGTYYTFVSRAIGAKWGFLVAWVYFLVYPVIVAQVGSFMGDTLEQTLKAEYGWHWFHWWYMMVFLIVVCAAAAWKGIELSTRVLVALGLFEILVCVAIAIFGFADPGPGGVSLGWLDPGKAPSNHLFLLAVIFAIFAISGWDAAAPIAEESKDPKRTVPRAVLGSIVVLGVFLVFVSWGQISGFGTSQLSKFGSGQLPAFALGHKYWHGAWVIVLIALFNSAVAVSIACTNAASRIFYSMGRSGVLPKSLAVLHPVNRTPVNAIWFQTMISTVLGLGLAIAIGQANVYNVTGTMFTFALIPVYVVANLGLFVFYRRDHPDEFNLFKHVVVGAISSVALLAVGYYSLSPWPPDPINLAFPIVVGWIVLGAIVLSVMINNGHRDWIDRAGETVSEVDVTPDERGARVPVAS